MPQLGNIMNTIQAVFGTSIESDASFSGSAINTDYLKKNLVIGKENSINWLNKQYKKSLFYDFWLVLSSPVK